MASRLVQSLASLAVLAATTGPARADEPQVAPAAAAPAPVAPAAAPPVKAAAVSTTPEGAAIVLVGDARPSGATDLARAMYRSAALKPRLDEGRVRALASGSSGDDPALAALAGLRAAIPLDLDSPEALPRLEAIAAETGVRALILFVPSATSEGGTVRIAHVSAAAPGSSARPQVRLDPATIQARPKAPASAPEPAPGAPTEPAPPDWADVVSSIERLVGPPPVAPPPKAANAGPLRQNLPGPKPHGPPEEPEEEEESVFESPWFWITAGTVAAAGITILIVSQTTDVNTGTVALKGKVLQ